MKNLIFIAISNLFLCLPTAWGQIICLTIAPDPVSLEQIYTTASLQEAMIMEREYTTDSAELLQAIDAVLESEYSLNMSILGETDIRNSTLTVADTFLNYLDQNSLTMNFPFAVKTEISSSISENIGHITLSYVVQDQSENSQLIKLSFSVRMFSETCSGEGYVSPPNGVQIVTKNDLLAISITSEPFVD